MANKIIRSIACPGCKAKGRDKTDNHLMIFETLTGYCDRCSKFYTKNDISLLDSDDVPHSVGHFSNDQEAPKIDKNSYAKPLSALDVAELPTLEIKHRGLKQKALAYYGVKTTVSEVSGEVNVVYFPYKGGKVYKVVGIPKQFMKSVGDTKGLGFFGQEVCDPNAKKIIVTEGEFDAIAAFSMMAKHRLTGDPKYRNFKANVVSIPDGAGSVKRVFADNLEFLSSFDEVLVCFDNDEPGQKAVKDAVEVLGFTDKLKIMKLPSDYKDANDALMGGQQGYQDFINAYYKAKPFVPSWVVDGRDTTLEEIMTPRKRGLTIPFQKLSEKLGGLREGELTVITAGTSCGKSTFTRTLGFFIATELKRRVAYLCLEQTVQFTKQQGVALYYEKAVKNLSEDPSILTEEEWLEGLKEVTSMEVYVDQFGSMSIEDLIEKIHYLVYAKDCKFIILDHLSMLIDGNNNQDKGGDHKVIGQVMTQLATFAVKTGCHIFIVSHIKRGNGSSVASKGGEILAESTKGSSSIEQLAFNIITLSRNVAEGSNVIECHIRKNRVWGETGKVCDFVYTPETGWMLEKQELGGVIFKGGANK
jgi:twinkle protein